MDLQFASDDRDRVEAFRRKHRIGLPTLVFTDIVGSTKLKQELGDRHGLALLQQHHALLRNILDRFEEAEEINTAGDSFFRVFSKPSDATKFALLLQANLAGLAKKTGRLIQNRIGIHFGEVFIEHREASEDVDDLHGLQADACARVMSLAQPNQILMSRFVFDNARQVLRGRDLEGVGPLSCLNHGPYVLKGVEEPLEICEVGVAGLAPLGSTSGGFSPDGRSSRRNWNWPGTRNRSQLPRNPSV
jgi:eukaryotic-like serine/threonine-protein kinase